MLIGLVGLIGSGKDTVAERLVSHHGFRRDSFARSLKDAVSNIFGWDRELLEGNTKESRAWREQPDAFGQKSLAKKSHHVGYYNTLVQKFAEVIF